MGRLGCIYKHTNSITGKSYVGQTVKSMMVRWSSHCNQAASMIAPNNYFHRALRKYSEDVWEHTLLEDGVPRELLDSKEIMYISKYNSFVEGYNSNIGGGSNYGYTHSQEQKDKIGKAHKGKKKSRESVEKQIKALTGRVMPLEQKLKLIKAQEGVKSHHFRPWWILYADGIFEEHYETTKSQYAIAMGWNKGSFRDRFSKSKKVGSPGKKGVFKNITVGNIGENYA